MEKSFQDDRVFKFMYSAFLSASQSTLYYLVNRYKNKPGFNNWFWGIKNSKGEKVGGQIDKPEIKHLMNARGSIIHVESIPQGATRELPYAVDCIIVNPRAPKESIPAESVGASNSTATAPTTIVRWLINEDTYMCYEKHGKIIDDTKHMPALKGRYSAQPTEPKNVDILKLSKAELEDAKKIVLECLTRFP